MTFSAFPRDVAMRELADGLARVHHEAMTEYAGTEAAPGLVYHRVVDLFRDLDTRFGCTLYDRYQPCIWFEGSQMNVAFGEIDRDPDDELFGYQLMEPYEHDLPAEVSAGWAWPPEPKDRVVISEDAPFDRRRR